MDEQELARESPDYESVGRDMSGSTFLVKERDRKAELEHKALLRAEEIGVIEYMVNGNLMEYWSFFGSEGWYFIRYDLDLGKEVFRGANIPWDPSLVSPVPAFLVAKGGGLLYNYMQG